MSYAGCGPRLPALRGLLFAAAVFGSVRTQIDVIEDGLIDKVAENSAPLRSVLALEKVGAIKVDQVPYPYQYLGGYYYPTGETINSMTTYEKENFATGNRSGFWLARSPTGYWCIQPTNMKGTENALMIAQHPGQQKPQDADVWQLWSTAAEVWQPQLDIRVRRCENGICDGDLPSSMEASSEEEESQPSACANHKNTPQWTILKLGIALLAFVVCYLVGGRKVTGAVCGGSILFQKFEMILLLATQLVGLDFVFIGLSSYAWLNTCIGASTVLWRLFILLSEQAGLVWFGTALAQRKGTLPTSEASLSEKALPEAGQTNDDDDEHHDDEHLFWKPRNEYNEANETNENNETNETNKVRKVDIVSFECYTEFLNFKQDWVMSVSYFAFQTLLMWWLYHSIGRVEGDLLCGRQWLPYFASAVVVQVAIVTTQLGPCHLTRQLHKMNQLSRAKWCGEGTDPKNIYQKVEYAWLRVLLAYISDEIYANFVVLITPFLLLSDKAPLDLVKDCFAVAFIVQLDNIQQSITLSVSEKKPEGARGQRDLEVVVKPEKRGSMSCGGCS